jgi:hypothetical protein
MSDYTAYIQSRLDLTRDHAARLILEYTDSVTGEIHQSFSGTVGQFLERIQSLCMHAEGEGQRRVHEWAVSEGVTMPCPACGKPMTPTNPLSEDVLICTECRYS